MVTKKSLNLDKDTNKMLAYIHIPFCESKCPYCAFNSYASKDELKHAYMNALLAQLQHDAKRFNLQAKSIESVFIGGGTPSTVEASLYAPLFDFLSFYLHADAEITSEANPSSGTKKWLLGMKELGVNRISFGVQSFQENKLKFLGRNHSKNVAIEAIESAFAIGINNLSLDLIYGTAVDNLALLAKDLSLAASLPINHLSAYALTLEKGTPFYRKNNVINPSEKLAKAFVSKIIEAGFFQYEISNFAKTYQSVHNKGYWQQKAYMGIGSGAVGFYQDQRFYPHKEVEAYIKNPLFYTSESLLKEELHLEKIFLGLRSNVGIPIGEFSDKERGKIHLLIDENKLHQKGELIFNNDYFLSDEIALFITD